MRTIDAGSFSLEPQVAGHAVDLFALLSDPEIYRFLDDGPPASLTGLGFGIGHSGVGADMLFEKRLGPVSALS